MNKQITFIYDLANYMSTKDFGTVASIKMWEMVLIAFVRRDKLPYVSNV